MPSWQVPGSVLRALIMTTRNVYYFTLIRVGNSL